MDGCQHTIRHDCRGKVEIRRIWCSPKLRVTKWMDAAAYNEYFFLPTSRNVLSTFQTYCPVGVQIAQMVVHFAHFQVQARKGGCFVYEHIPERSV